MIKFMNIMIPDLTVPFFHFANFLPFRKINKSLSSFSSLGGEWGRNNLGLVIFVFFSERWSSNLT